MAYAIIRTDLYGAANQPSDLVSLRFYSVDSPSAVENGIIVRLDGLEKNEREVWKAVAASANDDIGECAVVSGVEVDYDEHRRDLGEYINEAGKTIRGFALVSRNVFSVTKDAFEGATTPEVGQTVGVGDAGKIKSGATGLGKCVAIDTVGSYTYYSIRVGTTNTASAQPPKAAETGADRVSVANQGKSYSTLGGKKVSDLIDENVKIDWSGTTGTVTGKIRNISEPWAEFDQQNNTGHFFPVDLDEKYRGERITVIGNSQKTAADTEWVLRVENAKSNKFTFKKGSDTLFTLDFSHATLEGNA